MTLEGDFAHYRIVGRLGAGGMGEVYQAEDTRLGRKVALKVLPADLADDAERIARFRREAQILAALQHPRIAAIHGVEEAEGRMVLVLEFVEGEDLAQRLTRGALPADEALAFGRQIAEALEAAHEKGIVHRDLKPANVMLTPAGSIKVLDFGLAKALLNDSGEGVAGLSASPTLTHQGTQVGVVLGTIAYMSPEQARGRPVDRRADVWAFGCTLYEMLTGKRAFEGETTADIIAAIVKEEPDWEALPGDLPPAVPLLLRRCLVKDPLRRLQAIGEARLALETSGDPALTAALSLVGVGLPDGRPKPQSLTDRTGKLPWFVLSLLIIMAFVTVIIQINLDRRPSVPDAEPGAIRQLEIVISEDEPLATSPGTAIVGSRDGRRLAWVVGPGTATQLYVRDLAGGQPRAIAGTEGAYAPFFSPAGDWIGFFTAGSLKKVSVAGGTPIELAQARGGRGGTWLDDDRIVFAPGFETGLFVVDAAGGTAEALTERDVEAGERSHRWPHFLPGTGWVLFMSQAQGEAYDAATIEAVSLRRKKRHVVHEGGTYPRSSGDHLLFARGTTLFAARLDRDDAELAEEPRPILEGVVASAPDQEQGDGSAEFAASSGWLVYRSGGVLGSEGSLARLTPDGDLEDLLEGLRGGRNPAVSPDGRRVAFVQVADTANALWIYDLASETLDRLTFGRMSINSPVWTPDGEYVTFGAVESGEPSGIYWQKTDGSDGPVRLTEGSGRGQRLAAGPLGAPLRARPERGPDGRSPRARDNGGAIRRSRGGVPGRQVRRLRRDRGSTTHRRGASSRQRTEPLAAVRRRGRGAALVSRRVAGVLPRRHPVDVGAGHDRWRRSATRSSARDRER